MTASTSIPVDSSVIYSSEPSPVSSTAPSVTSTPLSTEPKPSLPCDTINCNNGGCVDEGNNMYSCQCNPGWTGGFCNDPVPPDTEPPPPPIITEPPSSPTTPSSSSTILKLKFHFSVIILFPITTTLVYLAQLGEECWVL